MEISSRKDVRKLLPIGNCPSFEDGLIDTVNARDLHAALHVGKQFATWITERIEQCNFKENEDFVVFPGTGKNPLGGRPVKDYFISLDMAKHLAMLQRSEVGKYVRTYFIEHEKQSRAIMPPSLEAKVAAAVAKAMAPMMTQVGSLTKALEDAAPKALGLPASHSQQPRQQSHVQVRGPERPRGDDRGQAVVRGDRRLCHSRSDQHHVDRAPASRGREAHP
ncbi:MAG: antA/AntB antirepressor family protein [Desulfovibrio aminophilus]|uniref:antA/AntB antirepressor family protein n=1 Tax=Desulfovibrio aminophilus TaxID=81425 RepID=UPI0039EC0AD2